MKTAFIHLRADPHYRIDAFKTGMERLGFRTELDQPYARMSEDDVLILWNKTARSKRAVEHARESGAAVIVLENGYYGRDKDGHQPYAMALDGHCGSGRWYVGDRTRLDALHPLFHPMKTFYPEARPCRVLVAGQRGIGSPMMASPPGFESRMAAELSRKGVSVNVRTHPGRHAPPVPLSDDLAKVDGVVVWSSNVATAALMAGLPTYYCAPHIATQGAAKPISTIWSGAVCTDQERMEAFIRVAWAQAFLDEIQSGEAMDRLIKVNQGLLPSCQEGLGL